MLRTASSLPLTPYPAPPGRTVRRVEWSFLPPAVRRWVEQRLGSPVVGATSQRSGFTPGMASVLTCADGSHHFVKAASVKAQPTFAESYRVEAERLRDLPAGVAAPRLRWAHEADGWFVMELEHVRARAPERPWDDAALAECLSMLRETAAALTPAPRDLAPDDLATELADWPGLWTGIARTWSHPRLAEAAALAAHLTEAPGVLAGDTVVHLDVRADNLLLTGDGRVLLCDWTWPARGPAWWDSLALLVEARGDGLDVEAVLARHPTFADAAPEAVDVALALSAGFHLHSAALRVPATSPWIREHQRWIAEVTWDWLCERRGWEPDLGGLRARC